MKSRLYRMAVAAFLLLGFCLTLLGGWQSYLQNDAWKIGDWLINYQGGFVRRGLVGQLAYSLNGLTNIATAFWLFAIQAFCYGLFFFCSWQILRRTSSLPLFVLLVFSPCVFVFQLWDFQGGYRKEILFFSAFALLAWGANRLSARHFDGLYFGLLLFYPLIILSHEILAIFLPYLVAAYLIQTPCHSRRWPLQSVLLIPSILAFYFSVTRLATPELVWAICESLGEVEPADCRDRSAIAVLQFSASWANRAVRLQVQDSLILWVYPGYFLLSLLAFLPLLGTLRCILRANIIRFLLITSWLSTLIVCALAIDWGRFIYMHVVALFLLCLSAQSVLAKGGQGSALSVGPGDAELGERILALVQRYPGRWVVLTLIYSICWHLPHAL